MPVETGIRTFYKRQGHLMNKLLLGAGLLAVAGIVATSAAQAQDWSGAYVGGSVTGSKLKDGNDRLDFDTNLDGQYGDTVKTASGNDAFAAGFCDGQSAGLTPADGCSKSKGDTALGLRAGYDWQAGDWVYGIVGEVTGNKLNDGVTGFSSTPATYAFSREVKNLSALRGRIGYASGDWLVYGTAGVAWADVDHRFTTTNNINSFTPTDKGKTGMGSQVGLGVEKKMGMWSVGLEYLHTSMSDRSGVVRVGPSSNTFASNPFLQGNPNGTDLRTSADIKINALSLVVSYRFGMM